MFKRKDNNIQQNDNNVKKFPKRKNKKKSRPRNEKVETIEIFKILTLGTDGKYKFAVTNSSEVDLKVQVNQSDEFNSMKKLWSRFKPKSVEAVFRKQINLVDKMLPELLIRFYLLDSSKIVDLPINPRACTHWSMLDNGVKKCYVPINPKTTDRDNCDWQSASDFFRSPIVCELSQALPTDSITQPIKLGIIKFKIKLLVEKVDVANLVQQDRAIKKQIEEKDNEIQQLKKLTREMATQTDNLENEEIGVQVNEEQITEDIRENEKQEEKDMEKEREEKEQQAQMKLLGMVVNAINDKFEIKPKEKKPKVRGEINKKKYVNPEPTKRNKTFRQGFKKYKKNNWGFNSNLPKGKGKQRPKKQPNSGGDEKEEEDQKINEYGFEEIGVKPFEDDDASDKPDYWDPNYEPDYCENYT